MVAAASKGIGLAIARELAAEGCRVSICARHSETLDSVLPSLGTESHATVCDVSQPADLAWWFEETLQRVGEPSILVTNTGGPPAGRLSEMSDEQWAAGYESTLMNVVRLVRIVAPRMVERRWGRIVHLTSLVAKEPSPMLPISSALRSGLMALTRLQASEFGPSGVTVNSVLPGHTLTDRQIHLAEIQAREQGGTVEAALAARASRIPLQRLARPDEVAAAVAFLCSERASYVTGTNLLVDGGSVSGLS